MIQKIFSACMLFMVPAVIVKAQKIPFYGFDKVRIVDSNSIIQAEIKPLSSGPHIYSNRFYYWYDANHIHRTQGGYSGQLLDGSYMEYYSNNKNLKEQGHFKKGLKNGIWKTWKDNGVVQTTDSWKKGKLIPKNRKPFWKRLNFSSLIFWKRSIATPDTLTTHK